MKKALTSALIHEHGAFGLIGLPRNRHREPSLESQADAVLEIVATADVDTISQRLEPDPLPLYVSGSSGGREEMPFDASSTVSAVVADVLVTCSKSGGPQQCT